MTTGQMWGADVEALDRLGRDLDAAAEQLASIRSRLRARIHASPWQGNDAGRFASDWDGVHRTALGAAQDALRAAGETVRRNASEQRRASSVAGSTPAMAALGGAATGALVGSPSAGGGSDLVRDVLRDLSRTNDAVGNLAEWMTHGGLVQFRPRWPAGTPGGLGGQFRSLSDMTPWERLKAVGAEESWVTKPHQGAARGSWESVGKWSARTGAVLSFAEGSYDQWTTDTDDPSLSTEARVTRAATTGTTTAAGAAAGAWAGAQLGGAVGSVGGPVGAAAGVVVGGVVGGALGSEAGQALGHMAADTAGDIADGLSDGLESAGGWISRHNPFG